MYFSNIAKTYDNSKWHPRMSLFSVYFFEIIVKHCILIRSAEMCSKVLHYTTAVELSLSQTFLRSPTNSTNSTQWGWTCIKNHFIILCKQVHASPSCTCGVFYFLAVNIFRLPISSVLCDVLRKEKKTLLWWF